MAKQVKVSLAETRSGGGWYSDGRGGRWSVARLWEHTKDLPVFDVPLAGMDLSGVTWRDSNLIELARHCKQVNEADLRYPIILDNEGSIADGRHRIIKSLMLGKTTIKAVRMQWMPEPCGKDDNK